MHFWDPSQWHKMCFEYEKIKFQCWKWFIIFTYFAQASVSLLASENTACILFYRLRRRQDCLNNTKIKSMRGSFKKGIFQFFLFYILEVFAKMSHFFVSIYHIGRFPSSCFSFISSLALSDLASSSSKCFTRLPRVVFSSWNMKLHQILPKCFPLVLFLPQFAYILALSHVSHQFVLSLSQLSSPSSSSKRTSRSGLLSPPLTLTIISTWILTSSWNLNWDLKNVSQMVFLDLDRRHRVL